MSGIFMDPPAFGGLVNINIKANKDQPLNLGQGSAPAPGPVAPGNLPLLFDRSITDTSITIYFDVTNVTGTQPIEYQVVYGTSDPLNLGLVLTQVSSTEYIGTANGLTPETIYSFQLEATNIADTTFGAIYQYETIATPLPPTVPPTVPTFVSSTGTSITIQFDVAPTGDQPGYVYGADYGLTTPDTGFQVTQYAGTLYRGTATGLTPDTNYVFNSTVTFGSSPNPQPVLSSATSAPFSTTKAPPPPSPTVPPTVPILISATSTSLTIQFDVAPTGNQPGYIYGGFYGETSPPALPYLASQYNGTVYRATITGLTPSTSYIFTSTVDDNTVLIESVESAPFSTSAPPVPSTLVNLAVLTFLAIDAQGNWSVNTSGMPDVGSMILTGAQAGTWSGKDGKAYLNSIRAKADTKLIVSMGGSGMNQFLASAFPNAQEAMDLCNTIWNVLFGAASTNPLNWSNAAWAGLPNRLYFDGLDLDMEGTIGTGILAAFMDQWISNQATYGGAVGHKILTMAPQSPNTWMISSPSTSVFTNNMTAVPYDSPDVDVSPIAAGFLTSDALIAPKYLQHFDYVFVQCYNQGAALYPGGVSFDPQMAQWAYLIMKARQVSSGVNTKLIFGFASTDAFPIWNATVDAPTLAAAIAGNINTPVSQALVDDGGSGCVPIDWCGGFGMWNSPTNINPITAVYATGSVLTKALVGPAAMMYANASGNNTTWDASLPLSDTRSAPT